MKKWNNIILSIAAIMMLIVNVLAVYEISSFKQIVATFAVSIAAFAVCVTFARCIEDEDN